MLKWEKKVRGWIGKGGTEGKSRVSGGSVIYAIVILPRMILSYRLKDYIPVYWVALV